MYYNTAVHRAGLCAPSQLQPLPPLYKPVQRHLAALASEHISVVIAPAVLAHTINAFVEVFVVPSIMDPLTNDNLFIMVTADSSVVLQLRFNLLRVTS
jgi:hypothetical protein